MLTFFGPREWPWVLLIITVRSGSWSYGYIGITSKGMKIFYEEGMGDDLELVMRCERDTLPHFKAQWYERHLWQKHESEDRFQLEQDGEGGHSEERSRIQRTEIPSLKMAFTSYCTWTLRNFRFQDMILKRQFNFLRLYWFPQLL